MDGLSVLAQAIPRDPHPLLNRTAWCKRKSAVGVSEGVTPATWDRGKPLECLRVQVAPGLGSGGVARPVEFRRVTEPETYESPAKWHHSWANNEERPGSGAQASEFWKRKPPVVPRPAEPAPPVGDGETEPEIVAELVEEAPPEDTSSVRARLRRRPRCSRPLRRAGILEFVGSAPCPRRVVVGFDVFRPSLWKERQHSIGIVPPARTCSPSPSRARRLRAGPDPMVAPAASVCRLVRVASPPPAHNGSAAPSAPAALRFTWKGHGAGKYARWPGFFDPVARRARVLRSRRVTSSDGKRSMFVQRSVAAGPDYQIVIRVEKLPSGTTLPFGLQGALQDRFLAGVDAPAIVHKVTIAGETAYEGQVHARNVCRSRGWRC